MEKAYISGKISGLEKEEFETLFSKASQLAIKMGYMPVNPVELKHDHDLTWENYMKIDIAELLTCHHMIMLPNWKESKGAKIEHDLGKELGLKIIYLTSIN